MKEKQTPLFQTLQQRVEQVVDRLKEQEVCLLAEGFGYEYGNVRLFGLLESRILVENQESK